MEKMFKWTSKAHNLRFVSLRYFNACGAHPNGQIGEAHNPETHLIPLILQVPNNQREYISVFGNDYDTKDGTCVRDYIHVNDLAQAHILAMKAKTFTAKAGGGMVSATVNGKHELVGLEINPEAVDPDDVEMLQDMVIAAVNEAIRSADNEAANNMSRLTGGLNLGGLF